MSMQKKIIKTLLFVALPWFIGASIDGEISELQEKMTVLEKYMQDHPLQKLPQERCQFGASFDVIYWQPKTSYTEVGGTRLNGSGDDRFAGSQTPPTSFSWSFGFKAGLFVLFESRPWQLGAEYTRAQFTGSFVLTPGASRLVEPNFGQARSAINSEWVERGSIEQSIDYQTATLLLSRLLRTSEHFCVTPSFGAKATWINQIPNVTYLLNGPPADPVFVPLDNRVSITEKRRV